MHRFGPNNVSLATALLIILVVLSRTGDAHNSQATTLGIHLSAYDKDDVVRYRGIGHRLLSSRRGSSSYRPMRFNGRSPSDYFVPDSKEDEDEEDFDYGEEQNKRGEAEENALERSGIRPWKLDLSPRYGHMSISSKLVLTNIACYALQLFNPKITRFGAKQSELILSGRELYRLVTPVFLHGGIVHLFMNAYSLSNIGPEVERLFGPGRFLATYFISGVSGNMLSAIRSPNPSVGASSAIFGLMGAQGVCLSRNEAFFGSYGQMGLESVLGAVMINSVFGAINPMIDNWGHIGGAIGGAAFAYTFGPKLYLLHLPNGGTTVVDKPKYQLPRHVRSLPDKFNRRFGRMRRRMQIEQFQSDLTAKPWRPRRRRPFMMPPKSRKHLKPRSQW